MIKQIINVFNSNLFVSNLGLTVDVEYADRYDTFDDILKQFNLKSIDELNSCLRDLLKEDLDFHKLSNPTFEIIELKIEFKKARV